MKVGVLFQILIGISMYCMVYLPIYAVVFFVHAVKHSVFFFYYFLCCMLGCSRKLING